MQVRNPVNAFHSLAKEGLYEAGGSLCWATLSKNPDIPADVPSLAQVMKLLVHVREPSLD